MHSRLSGLIAATYAPFTDDHQLHLETLPAYIALLGASGVSGAFVSGTTGEFTSLTLAERMALAQAWVQTADELTIVIHVGHHALAEAQQLAVHAQQIGADAIACMAPAFFRPQSIESLVDWCAAVASAAPTLPFYYYHIPTMNGVTFPVPAILKEAARRLPTLAGVKFSHDNLDEFSECIQWSAGRYNMLIGRDELLKDAIKRGADGAVGTTYNYAAPVYLEILAAQKEGQVLRARDAQALAIRMMEACSQAGVTHLAASKTVMKALGVNCGPVRLPLSSLRPSDTAQLHSQLRAMGIL